MVHRVGSCVGEYDDEIVEIGKTSKIDVSILKQELVNRVKSKQIKCINDIVESIGELTK